MSTSGSWRPRATAWGVDVADLAFMPVGLDGNAWAYRVDTTDGERCFLKRLDPAGLAGKADTEPLAYARRGRRKPPCSRATNQSPTVGD